MLYILIPVMLYVFLMFTWCCCKGKKCDILGLSDKMAKKIKYGNCSHEIYNPENFEITFRMTNPVDKDFVIKKRQKTQEMETSIDSIELELNGIDAITNNVLNYAKNSKDDAKIADEKIAKIENEKEMDSSEIITER